MSLQGPHHCAWKSTSTGTSLPRTISSKLVNCCVFTASTVIVAERPTVAVPLQSNERRPWITEGRRKRGAELRIHTWSQVLAFLPQWLIGCHHIHEIR